MTGITNAWKKKEKKGGMFPEDLNIVEVIRTELTVERRKDIQDQMFIFVGVVQKRVVDDN